MVDDGGSFYDHSQREASFSPWKCHGSLSLSLLGWGSLSIYSYYVNNLRSLNIYQNQSYFIIPLLCFVFYILWLHCIFSAICASWIIKCFLASLALFCLFVTHPLFRLAWKTNLGKEFGSRTSWILKIMCILHHY